MWLTSHSKVRNIYALYRGISADQLKITIYGLGVDKEQDGASTMEEVSRDMRAIQR
jgi:hypothetical protein